MVSTLSTTSSQTLDLSAKITGLIKVLENDLNACDFKWTLFVAAAHSYRHESVLKPIPATYIVNKTCDLERLHTAIARVPNFCDLLPKLRHLAEQRYCDGINEETIDLLYWCLHEPTLKSVDRADFDNVLQKVISVVPCPRPTHIFEVNATANPIAEDKFRSYRNEKSTIFGYHGSKLECFHSILNYGLQQHLCKNALFGEGIYLSSELHVSLMFSPTGLGWNKSVCGKKPSCLAIGEFINHPEHLKCHSEEKKPKKSGVPDKYFVITNNDIIRVRYLIVYGKTNRLNSAPTQLNNVLGNWVNSHKCISAMILYAVILIAIGISNSRTGYHLQQYLKGMLHNFVEFIKTINLGAIRNLFKSLE